MTPPVMPAAQAHAASARRSAAYPISLLKQLAVESAPVRDLVAACRMGRPAMIGETRQAVRAARFASDGVAAISVRTDPGGLEGGLADLLAVRGAVEIPLLQRDVIVSEYQVWEARAYGADALSLAPSVLTPGQLSDLYGLTTALGMAALLELTDERDAHAAAELRATCIGIADETVFDGLTRLLEGDTVAVAIGHDSPTADAILTGNAH